MKKGGLFRILVVVADWVSFILTILLAVGLLLSYFSPYVNPHKSLVFPFLGLAVPLMYILNVVVALYWTIRWRRIALVSIIVAVVGLGSVGKYYRVNFGKEYVQQQSKGAIKILSYNVAGFWNFGTKPVTNTMSQVKSYIKEQNPDVIFIQEFETSSNYTIDNFREGMEEWKYEYIRYFMGEGKTSGWGVAIFAKFPLSNRAFIDFEGSNNSVLVADMVVNRDTIKLFNHHLQTTQVNENDREYLGGDVFTDSGRSDKVLGIARKLGRNFRIRADQADTLAIKIRQQKGSVIVGGDLNDTPMSYTYRKIRGDLVDSFRRSRGAVATYNDLAGVLRIDYIMHSKDYQTLSYKCEVQPWSDHNPIVVEIKKRGK